MADLIVTFALSNSRAVPNKDNPTVPLAMGSSIRSEAVAIAAAAAGSTNKAQGNENIVFLSAGVDCWVALGAAPVAAKLASGGTKTGTSMLLRAGDYQFAVTRGDMVSVIAA